MIGAAAIVAVLVTAGVGIGIQLRSDEQPEAVLESMVPDRDCVVPTGPEPWIILWDRSPKPCVVVAEFQNVQVWNKGFEPMTVDWPGGERSVAIDEHFDTGPSGGVLQANPNDEIDAAPFPIPVIWLLPESLSPTVGIEATDDGFGPVRVGMTLDEASAALGPELDAPSEATPEPDRWLATGSGDPYSPTFLALGPGDRTSVIVEIYVTALAADETGRRGELRGRAD